MADPISVAVAAAIAGKVAESLTDAGKRLLAALRQRVQDKLKDDPNGLLALLSATQDPENPDRQVELAEAVEAAEAADPAFRTDVRELWKQVRAESTGPGTVRNTIRGDVRDGSTVVQAGHITGDINLR
ncbi:hypothetical protein [Marinitenerispora sediminis]|uniref:Uncharacterized protein n=1 Tax=Marinitenerispora sediminis TaxID=1931232 RepID=A0A368T8X9_9ACTN|nr:hypothetical protein [Marinitenerispora sediminis]RCV53598.1 hypothetical protein DEF28_10240 [Marinitenerispora sediminis]RCV55959.1 hypothetical protein DEF23_13530 [Marinitenerispora sediminis]RCV60673.1 hypothetical protein DEF24_06425 [Marinitenerispora sediminis]